MAFPTRHKYSAHLIPKATANTYDTFEYCDENNGNKVPTISKQKIGHAKSEKAINSPALSPIPAVADTNISQNNHKCKNPNSVSQPVTPTEPNKLKPKFKLHNYKPTAITVRSPPPKCTNSKVFYAANNIPKQMALIESRESSYSKEQLNNLKSAQNRNRNKYKTENVSKPLDSITRSNSNSQLISFSKLRLHPRSPASQSQFMITDLTQYMDANHTMTSHKSSKSAFIFGRKYDDYDNDMNDTMKTDRDDNKKFILQRLQQTSEASLYRRRSTVFSMNRECEYEYEYEDKHEQEVHTQTTTAVHDIDSTKQLVYIGGINDRNKYDVRDRLFDLFEMWLDKPSIIWNTDSLYVGFPSIAKAIDGINVFDGVQPNGYILCAELVLEGSQMVYIDGLDGDWNKDVFIKNFADIRNNYKVSVKNIISDKAYAFVEFESLEAVQSAIDKFDAETEIDGKLVRWQHMVKAYIGQIGNNTSIADIQKELSEFDASFKHLPVEIRKYRESIYYGNHIGMHDHESIEMMESMDTKRKQSFEEQKSAIPMAISSDSVSSPRYSLVSSNNENSDDIENDNTDFDEYEWHYYAYIWFFNKYDAMRARTRFDHRNCFGSKDNVIRFLLMNDMTQKVYVSGLMEGCSNSTSIEDDITKYSNDSWSGQCIITYRANSERPFAYLRFPSMEAAKEAVRLFDHKICFGNQRFLSFDARKVHLEIVKDENDLLCHDIIRIWNWTRYCHLTLSFIFLPLCLTIEWWMQLYYRVDDMHGYHSTKHVATKDLLSALFGFNVFMKKQLMNGHLLRFLLIVMSYAMYVMFYFLFSLDDMFSILLPLLLYCVIAQLFCCWSSLDFEVEYPQFHVLEHVSMYFEDTLLYCKLHVMASDFAASKQWNAMQYPCDFPIEWRVKLVLPSAIYAALFNWNSLASLVSFSSFNSWIRVFVAVTMFSFCYILFCVLNTIISRTLSYWRELHDLTDLITCPDPCGSMNDNKFNFLKLDSENNVFAWLSMRSYLHRKGDVVFCGLEIHSLFLVLISVLNLVTIIIVMFDHFSISSLLMSSLVLSQMWLLCVSLYYLSYLLLIGYWFASENRHQLNRVERHKLFIYTERMKQLLNHQKYKLIENTKIIHLKLLLNSMEALVQHIETKEITPKLWGIKMNQFKWKLAMTLVAASIPSVIVRWILNVN